jgi:hypothetical protein
MVQKNLDHWKLCEVGFASVSLVARALLIPASNAWRDVIVLLCTYWIFSALVSSARAWAIGTAAFVSLLLGIYAWGVAPHILGSYGIQP